nr:thioredoxin family protein [Kofleriaceae bacterium]
MTKLGLLAIAIAACGGAAPVHPDTPPPQKTLQVNATGALIDVDASTVSGYVTVVDFWSESCGACEVVGGMLAVQTAHDPMVVIRKVDVGDADNQLSHAYKIGALPHYNVYDKQRRLRYVLVGNDCLDAPKIARQLASE